MSCPSPTVFHVTHWKAGSQWIAEILKHSAPERFVPWEIADPHAHRGFGAPRFYMEAVIPGRVYGTVYLPRGRLESIVYGQFWRNPGQALAHPRSMLRNLQAFSLDRSPCKFFMVIRDLRDTLVSLYFSTKHSHALVVDRIGTIRGRLMEETKEDGLLYLMEEVLPRSARIQASWVGAAGVRLLRYEDILGNEQAFFEELLDYTEIEVSRERLRDIVRYNTFEAATGRKRGEEDLNAHLRKGVAGDWRNHFTDAVKEEFKKHFGALLVDTGYERDLNW